MENGRFRTAGFVGTFVILLATISYGHTVPVPAADDLFRADITMTNLTTTQEDEYAYVQYKLPDEELFIVGYAPLINSSVAHHMLTYACGQPAFDTPFWRTGGICRNEQTIIHGWSLNAPPLKLPEDVGFPVGRNTPYKYIVVNIHYLVKANDDNSGNQIVLSRKPRKYHAGIMLAASGQIYIPRKTHTVRTPFSCRYEGPPISIFAVRVHAHQWGRVNSLYRVRDGKVSQIAKGSPQWPQSFYSLPSAVVVQNGDGFIGQCVYDNDDDRDIHVGSTHRDEMCNVYAMYSYEAAIAVDGRAPAQSCWGDGDMQMSKLMPFDSLLAPASPADIGGTNGTAPILSSTGDHGYRNIENWPRLKSPSDQLGHVGGIALTTRNDQLVVFHRGARTWDFQYFDGVRFRHERHGPIGEDVLTHIDTRTGQIKARWGAKMFYMPHGLTIDHRGNFWLTDVAMHQVFMFTPENLTHPALTVGEKFESGAGPNHFCRPADVAVMKNGDFFVADGYCNTRIVKFNAQGQFIKEWGLSMSGRRDADGYALPNEWNIVHSIALNEDAQLVCGADRENFRIQCFHPETGNFLRQIHVASKVANGAIYAIEFVPNAHRAVLFAVTGGPQTMNKTVYRINAQSGETITSFDTQAYLTAPHDISVSATATELYVGELVSPPASSVHKFEIFESQGTPKTEPEVTSREPLVESIAFLSRRLQIALVLGISSLLATVITLIGYCIYRLRQRRKIQRLNTLIVGVKTDPHGSIFSRWIDRRQGFDRLAQDAEEEGQLLNSDEENQSVAVDGTDGAVQVEIKQKSAKSNNRSNGAALKMEDDL